MSQKSSVPQAVSFVSQVLKRDIFINLLLRPIVQFINRQPLRATELEVGYLVSLTCRNPDEAHIRALLLQSLARGDLALQRLDSTDVNGTGRVVVNAHLIAHSRVDAAVEDIVGRLSLEPAISAARWQVRTDIDLDHQSLIDSAAAG